jgi:hypothetical protein
MVTTTDRKIRILESRKKICPPAMLDDDLCFYSPQENVEALKQPRVRQWLKFISEEYIPKTDKKSHSILLLLPCTKTKPYLLSPEHLHINSGLIAAGFRPQKGESLVADFAAHLPSGFSPDVLSLAPLKKSNVVIHRAVISEPLVLVPYEFVFKQGIRPSPACAYDDPGLFEARGNAVSPWRKDFTGIAVSPTKWRWGSEETRAYVTMHNEMSKTLAQVIARLRPHYDAVVAWVSPGLTHRSFILARDQRSANGVAAARRVGKLNLQLHGANDLLLPAVRIECLPTIEQCAIAKARLAKRLGRSASAIGGYYSRGGGGATPLALPELLKFLVTRLGKT